MNRPAGCCLAKSSVIRVPDDDHVKRTWNKHEVCEHILLKWLQNSLRVTESKFDPRSRQNYITDWIKDGITDRITDREMERFERKKIVNIIIICKIISEKSKIWWLKLEMLRNSQNEVCDLMECRLHCKFLHSKTPCSHLQTAESRSAV